MNVLSVLFSCFCLHPIYIQRQGSLVQVQSGTPFQARRAKTLDMRGSNLQTCVIYIMETALSALSVSLLIYQMVPNKA